VAAASAADTAPPAASAGPRHEERRPQHRVLGPLVMPTALGYPMSSRAVVRAARRGRQKKPDGPARGAVPRGHGRAGRSSSGARASVDSEHGPSGQRRRRDQQARARNWSQTARFSRRRRDPPLSGARRGVGALVVGAVLVVDVGARSRTQGRRGGGPSPRGSHSARTASGRRGTSRGSGSSTIVVDGLVRTGRRRARRTWPAGCVQVHSYGAGFPRPLSIALAAGPERAGCVAGGYTRPYSMGRGRRAPDRRSPSSARVDGEPSL
jgi:hypothetical protein